MLVMKPPVRLVLGAAPTVYVDDSEPELTTDDEREQHASPGTQSDRVRGAGVLVPDV